MSASNRSRLVATNPVLVVSDLKRSLNFYVGRLGFREPAAWGEPRCFAMCNRDGFDLMFNLVASGQTVHPNGPSGVWDLCLRVADIAEEIADLRGHGVAIAKGPTDTFYGMREIEVLDPDGFRICLAQDISNALPATGPEEIWDGLLDVGSAKLRLVLKLWHDSKGRTRASFDSPDQGAVGVTVDRIDRSATVLAFQMTRIVASFVGTFADERTLRGQWSQNGRAWPLDWTRR